MVTVKRLKFLAFIYRHLQGNPNSSSLKYNIRSGVLASTSNRWRGADSGRTNGLSTGSSSSTWLWMVVVSEYIHKALTDAPCTSQLSHVLQVVRNYRIW